jgi:hypothetical protein
MKIISLGHRCHLNQMLIKYNIRKVAFPFDNIISKLEGVIYCIQNKFECFFPKKIEKEIFNVGKNDQWADKNGNRFMFRTPFFAFTHHDLTDSLVINNFKNRIERFIHMLETTNEEILFIRTVMDDDEIKLIDRLNESIIKRFPNLIFKIAFIYDNTTIEQNIWNYKDKYILANSCYITNDQNNKTSDIAYRIFFEYIINKRTLKEIMDNITTIPENLILKNDSYKGWAIKKGIYPYKEDT